MTQARASAFGELDIWLARAGRHEQLYAKLGAHPVESGVRFAVWAPNATVRQRDRRLQRLGPGGRTRCSPSTATGIWEGVVEGAERRRSATSTTSTDARRPTRSRSRRSCRRRRRRSSSSRRYEWLDADWIEERRHAGAARAADDDLRGARAVVAQGARLARARRPARAVRQGSRLHARRAAAGDAPPVLGLVGLPGDRLLRAASRRWARPTTSGTSSTTCTRTASACCSTGCRRTSRPTSGRWRGSTARRSTSTTIRAAASIPTGARYVFNLGRSEVQNFLLANALFWLREYHADGIRVDAVASMLYLDYSRKDGEWVPNAFGGREDLDAVAFLKEFNELVHAREPGVISAAEESTAWPGVSRPTYVGGLGFGFKWNMGWMHDTLSYFQRDPDPPQPPPPRADVLARLRVERELHPPALARRGRARQGLAAREDAGRPLAAACEPALALRVHVVASRQEAALHGRRARDAVGVGARRTSCRGGCSSTPSTRACAT